MAAKSGDADLLASAVDECQLRNVSVQTLGQQTHIW